MFITDEDYKVMVGEKSFEVINQSSEENRQRAEKMAIEEIKGYLRPRYDVEAVFEAEGEARNDQIVMRVCDVALYHMVSWLPNKMGYEIREIRYKMAIDYLDKVQKGTVTPDLPTIKGENGEEDIYNPIRFGSGKANRYDW